MGQCLECTSPQQQTVLPEYDSFLTDSFKITPEPVLAMNVREKIQKMNQRRFRNKKMIHKDTPIPEDYHLL